MPLDDDDDVYAIGVVVVMNNLIMIQEEEEDQQKKKKHKIDHRKLPRAPRRKFNHAQALHCIKRDHLGSDPLFGKQFKSFFRLSRERFELLMQDVMNNTQKFEFFDHKNKSGPSLEARLLLPLKTLAFGVAPHAFCDYFQMSFGMARQCCIEFDKAVEQLYYKKYMKFPTAVDTKRIVDLHKSVHGVDGMLGSLDCSHTWWKNCPVAWQGSFKGKESKPSIALEAMCDYNMYFWHAVYGFSGCLNDIQILGMSPLLAAIVNGSFETVEEEAGVTPFKVGDEEFKYPFILVDGIYPKYNRFVQGIKIPVGDEQKKYTQWQEAARKDIERAFGVLKNTWQYLQNPIMCLDLSTLSKRVRTCLILHNMLVSDRVMGDVNQDYNPCHAVEEEEELCTFSTTHTPRNSAAATGTSIGIDQCPIQTVQAATNAQRFHALKDTDEHIRLYLALSNLFNKKK